MDIQEPFLNHDRKVNQIPEYKLGIISKMTYQLDHSLLCMRTLVVELQYTPYDDTERLRCSVLGLVQISQKSKEQSTTNNPCCFLITFNFA